MQRFAIGLVLATTSLAQTSLQRQTLTYFGGSATDVITAVAVDPSGYIYVAGWTSSPNLPVKSAYQAAFGGSVDVYVARIAPDGRSLLYCTYLGGSGDDRAFAIAVDVAGNAYVTGWSQSPDFPITPGAFQRSNSGGKDAFVTELNSSGAVVYSSYFGGSGQDTGNGIAIDSGGNVFVAGATSSTNFPLKNAIQPRFGGTEDAFLFKLAPSGSGLLFSTYLGGSLADAATALSLDPGGYVYLTGSTQSPDFPALAAFQPKIGGAQNAFAAKLTPSGSALVYSSFLGGTGGSPEGGLAIAVDSAGAAYVAGVTPSRDFPILNAFQSEPQGDLDGFVAKISPGGGSLAYSSYLGGTSADLATSIVAGAAGSVWIAGYTASTNFPVTAGPSNQGGPYDAFLAQIVPGPGGLLYSALTGGSASDAANAVASHNANLYVAGQTASVNLADNNSIQPHFAGNQDGFLAVFSQTNAPVVTISSPANNGTYTTSNAAVTLSGTATDSAGIVQVAWTNDRGGVGISSGTSAWTTAPIPLQPGMNDIAVTAQDSTGLHGTATLQVNYAPGASVVISPGTGTGVSQSFTGIYVYNGGLAGVTDAALLVQTGLTAVSACVVTYRLQANQFFLMNDAGTAWLGPVVPGSSAILQNSQCALSGSASSAAVNGSMITATFSLTFLPTFAGLRNTYLYAGGAWQSAGDWLVGPFPPTATLTPASGSGSTQIFTGTYDYPGGLAGVSEAALLLQSALNNVNACEVTYDLATQAFYLLNDAATVWLGPLYPSSAKILQNSQCALIGSGTTANVNGSVILASFSLSFSSAFLGQKTTYLWIANTWQTAGSWNVMQPQPTAALAPTNGSGGTQLFSATYIYPNGFAGVSEAALLLQSALNNVNACEVTYDLATQAFYLLNDAATVWLGPLYPGSAKILQNSQCTLIGSSSTAAVNGSVILVSFSLSFSPSFVGRKTTYLWIANTWQTAGAWNVQP